MLQNWPEDSCTGIALIFAGTYYYAYGITPFIIIFRAVGLQMFVHTAVRSHFLCPGRAENWLIILFDLR